MRGTHGTRAGKSDRTKAMPRTRGRRWMQFRRFVLNSVGWRCERCGAAARLELHHPVPVSEGGAEFDRANIEVLCRACHIAHHREHPGRANRGWPDVDRPPGFGAWKDLANEPIQ